MGRRVSAHSGHELHNEEGYLQITDRIKDVIKTGGEWISSLQIEDVLTQHESVSRIRRVRDPQ